MPDTVYLHANMLAYCKRGFLIFGAPNSGKSFLSYHLVKSHGFTLISDDLVQITQITSPSQRISAALPNPHFSGCIHLKKRGLIRVKAYQYRHPVTHILSFHDHLPKLEDVKLTKLLRHLPYITLKPLTKSQKKPVQALLKKLTDQNIID